MLGYTGRNLVIVLAAVLCVVGIVSLALIYFFPAPPSTITMAVGFKGGSYGLLADRYKEILARDHVDLVLRNAAGGAEHFKLLQDKSSNVQAAMVQGGISDDEKSPGLLSIGRINYQIFCVFYRATEMLGDLTELKGKRIAVGPGGAAGRIVAEKVLAISGVTSENSTLLPLTGLAAADALNDGKADAAILGLSSDAPMKLLPDIFRFWCAWSCRKARLILRKKFLRVILSCSRPPTRSSCATIFIPHISFSWHRHSKKHTTIGDFFNKPANSPLRPILNFQWPRALSNFTKTAFRFSTSTCPTGWSPTF